MCIQWIPNDWLTTVHLGYWQNYPQQVKGSIFPLDQHWHHSIRLLTIKSRLIVARWCCCNWSAKVCSIVNLVDQRQNQSQMKVKDIMAALRRVIDRVESTSKCHLLRTFIIIYSTAGRWVTPLQESSTVCVLECCHCARPYISREGPLLDDFHTVLHCTINVLYTVQYTMYSIRYSTVQYMYID